MSRRVRVGLFGAAVSGVWFLLDQLTDVGNNTAAPEDTKVSSGSIDTCSIMDRYVTSVTTVAGMCPNNGTTMATSTTVATGSLDVTGPAGPGCWASLMMFFFGALTGAIIAFAVGTTLSFLVAYVLPVVRHRFLEFEEEYIPERVRNFASRVYSAFLQAELFIDGASYLLSRGGPSSFSFGSIKIFSAKLMLAVLVACLSAELPGHKEALHEISMQKFQNEIDRLLAERRTVERQLLQLQIDRENASRQNLALARQLSDACKQVEDASRNLNAVKSENITVKGSFDTTLAALNECSHERSEEGRQYIRDLCSKSYALQAAKNRLSETNDRLNEANDKLNEANDKLNEANDRHSDLERLRQKESQEQSALTQHFSSLYDDKTKEAQNLAKSISDLETQGNETSARLENEIRLLQDNLNAKKTVISALREEAKFSDKASEEVDLHHKEIVADLQNKVDEANKQCNDRNTQLDALKGNLSMFRTQLDRQRNAKTKLEVDLESKSKALQLQKEKSVEDHRQLVDAHQRELCSVKDQLMHADKQRKETATKYFDLVDQLENLEKVHSRCPRPGQVSIGSEAAQESSGDDEDAPGELLSEADIEIGGAVGEATGDDGTGAPSAAAGSAEPTDESNLEGGDGVVRSAEATNTTPGRPAFSTPLSNAATRTTPGDTPSSTPSSKAARDRQAKRARDIEWALANPEEVLARPFPGTKKGDARLKLQREAIAESRAAK